LVITGENRRMVTQNELMKLIKQKYTRVEIINENQKGDVFEVIIKKIHKL